MSEIDCDAAAEATGYEYAMDCLKEEMEVLRKNARRYEFVRAHMGVGFSVSNGFCIYVTNKYYEELDEAVDSAMGSNK